MFDKRQTHWTTLVDLEAVTLRTIYDDVNCVAAGWVAHPLDVPLGHHLGFDLWKAGGIAVPKPENDFFSRKLPKELELRLTPPIALVRQFDGDLDAIVAALTELRDVRLEALARERRSPVRGVKKMRAVHPWDEPDTDKEVIGRPVRTFSSPNYLVRWTDARKRRGAGRPKGHPPTTSYGGRTRARGDSSWVKRDSRKTLCNAHGSGAAPGDRRVIPQLPRTVDGRVR